ncbi:outer membrane protein [Chelatococcus asaccharovorans]|uniref:Outer membrane immunogenic protein n=1 Tax=Chelatococcus asaccharovorans TaxID=28210 RepID=A0A2V3U2B3_9HYPH|nr:outer membrane protein [Chelatococcus asaccharovorans]MBS7704404.1 porin family protein [Chelatococcus asaccharovorans]PXW55716.1 outer membrane immunogenic protein [Chelatococcus asaccharovorans]
MRNILRIGTLSLLGACGFVGQVLAADLPSRASAPVAPIVVAPVFTWTGFYGGIHGGYSRFSTGKSYKDIKKGANDWAAGAQGGYNYQFGSWVVGAEADFDKHFGKLKASGRSGQSLKIEQGYGATVRARLGYAFDRVLVYGTGGLALSQMSIGTPSSKTKSHWHPGFAVGAGVEYAVTDNVSVRGEYLYTKVSQAKYVMPDGGVVKEQHKGGEARLGLNYKF